MKHLYLILRLALTTLIAFAVPGWGLATALGLTACKHLDTASGLSNNYVLSLAADGDGYVWVGTERGLNRVSAGCCIPYTDMGAEQTDVVRGNADKVTALFFCPVTNRLFVGTEQGLLLMDCMRQTFLTDATRGDRLVNYGIQDIAAAADSALWLIYGNGALQLIDRRTLEVRTFPSDPLPGARSGLDDGKGHLYVGTGKSGMCVVDLGTGRVVRRYAHNASDVSSLPGDNVRRLFADSRGGIWVGTDHGLAFYDPRTDAFRTVTQAGRGPLHENVFDIIEMADGRLGIACDVGGMLIVDPQYAAGAGPLHYDCLAAPELSSLNTRALVQDSHRNLWVGNHSTGVDIIPDKEPFLHVLPYYRSTGKTKQVGAIAADGADGTLWVNGDDELSRWTGGVMTGEWTIGGMQGRPHPSCRCMMADSQGYVWIGLEDEGVVRFSPRDERFEHIDIGYGAPDIHTFFEDTDGSIWIGSELGVCIYRHGTVAHDERIDRLTRRAPVTSFLRLSADVMAMATQGHGLLVYNERTGDGKSLHISDGLPSENINQALADNVGGLWLATNAGIVWIADWRRTDEMKLFDENDGLADNQIQAIGMDGRGRLWASTYSGITCIDVPSRRIYNYSGSDASPADGFSVGAVATTAEGLIAFGSPGGVCFFDPREPDRQRGAAVHPRIALIEVFEPAVGMDDRRRIPTEAGTLTLSHRQNTVRMVVTHDNYAYEGFVDFSYQMKGLGEGWYAVGRDQEVAFQGLKPRRYTFTLRAKLKNQDWSEATAERLAIVVRPPFWLSWWAWAVYAAAAMSGCALGIRSYKRKLRLKASLDMEKMHARQMQQIGEERLRFFTNIAHELRTPLSLIIGPLDDMTGDDQLSPPNRRRVATMYKSARRLRALIDDILEFRKTETQNRRLTVAVGDIGEFVSGMVADYQTLARNAGVELRLAISPCLPRIYFDSEAVTTIVGNLLTNALKYTPQGSVEVRVELTDGGDRVAVSVTDTGYGIAADALPHVFDRYYQAQGAHQASGTGIGLALAAALASLHEASLTAESEEGRGSRFTLALSVANRYPHALHKDDADSVADGPSHDDGRRLAATGGADTDAALPALLVVEDNADIRTYIADTLAADYRIMQAADGVEGFELATTHVPDIIVSDVMMPRMDGMELTKRLKADVRTSHIPVVMLTAKDTPDDRTEGYDSGADSYLTKPFTARLLASRIANLLQSRRRLAEQLSGTLFAVHAPAPDAARETMLAGHDDLSPLDKEFIHRLNDVIETNILQQELDMPFLTDKMAMSHSTFYRKVKALTGLTASEYVRKMRLSHCRRLLESGDYNVTEAAAMTGFNQMAHFRAAFKSEFGMLPSEVKKEKGK